MTRKSPPTKARIRSTPLPRRPVFVDGAAQLSDLVADPHNRRRHNERNIAMIVDALKSVGAARSIVIDEKNEVLAGNGVLAAATAAGLTKVQVVDAEGDTIIAVRRRGLSEDDKRKLALYDNRTGELAEWNADQLLADLAAGADFAPWFSDQELKSILTAGGVKEGKTDPDLVPTPRRTSIRLGDAFALGAHRLVCGDCTDVAVVERLMQGVRAGLMNTDPPYGIAFDNAELGSTRKAYPAIANDAPASGDALQVFLEAAFGTAKRIALVETAAWYLWHAHLTQGFFAAAAAAAANLVLHRQIIWVKPRLILGRGQYHWKHELCFMGWVEGHPCPDYGLGQGERTQTTVWEVAGVTTEERATFNHASPKPVELFAIPIVKHLRATEACYDPFAGTGPQFIAAEQRGVTCYGLDIDPTCCQVIVDRWEAFTGLKATKLGTVAGAAPRRRQRAR